MTTEEFSRMYPDIDAAGEPFAARASRRCALRSGVNLFGDIPAAELAAIDAVLHRIGTHVNAVVSTPREERSPLGDSLPLADGALDALMQPSFIRSVERMRATHGIPFVAGAPVGLEPAYRWVTRIGEALGLNRAQTQLVAVEERAKLRAELDACRLDGLRCFLAGDTGRELALAGLLLDAGAFVPYVATRLSPPQLARGDDYALRKRGCTVLTASDDACIRAALDAHAYDCAFGAPLTSRAMAFANGAREVLEAVARSAAGAAHAASETVGDVHISLAERLGAGAGAAGSAAPLRGGASAHRGAAAAPARAR